MSKLLDNVKILIETPQKVGGKALVKVMDFPDHRELYVEYVNSSGEGISQNHLYTFGKGVSDRALMAYLKRSHPYLIP
jgi:hypothetical protein